MPPKSEKKYTAVQALAAPSAPTDRRMGNQLVRVDAVYHVTNLSPQTRGPWNGEADKVAWTEVTTGYGCIIRRAEFGGHLCGYVGVGPDHPVFRYHLSAINSLGLKVHGGISYAETCQRHEGESTSICHVTVGSRSERTVVEMVPHDDMWWIGFECNQPTDVIPEPSRSGLRPSHLPSAPDGTVAAVYRDEAYVLDQCRWLAEQLKAIEDGHALADVPERPLPPAGFNPSKAVR